MYNNEAVHTVDAYPLAITVCVTAVPLIFLLENESSLQIFVANTLRRQPAIAARKG